MVDMVVETIEPDPSATSIANDQTVNNTKDETVADIPKETSDEHALTEDKTGRLKDAPSVEAEGHTIQSSTEDTGPKEDGAPSDRVKDAQKWNNRDRSPKNFKQNIKSDLTSQPISSDPIEIRKQVEFYFSDSNLMSDNFLYSKVEGHQNLPVPLSIIHSFKRMRHFQPYSAILEALKESTILNVTDNDSCVQRKIPLPEHLKDKPMVEIQKVYEDEAMARSVYVKGFGEEQPSTQFDIEAFFAEYGSTKSVRLRRAQNKFFKSSVFVEFDSDTTQKAFLALDPKPKWKGNDLLIKSKKQYCDEKVEDIRSGKIQRHQPDGQSNHRGKRGDDDTRDWRERRNEDSKSGFKDRNGRGHRGFGSSGRGRGGGRGRGRDRDGKDGRDRNGRDRNEEKRRGGDENTSPTIDSKTKENGVPKIAVPEPTKETITPDKASATSKEPTSKKRAREDHDDGTQEQNTTKKVDAKDGDS